MPCPTKPAMQRLVAGAAAGDQRHLARLQRPAADEFVPVAEHQDIGMRGDEAVEAFGQHGVDGVDELLHGRPPVLIGCQPPLPAMLVMLLDEFVDGAVERGVLLVVAEVGHGQRQMPRLAHAVRPAGVLPGCAMLIGGEKLVALGRAEMADGEDRRQML